MIAERIQGGFLDRLSYKTVVRIVSLRGQQFKCLVAFGDTYLLFSNRRIDGGIGQALIGISAHRDRNGIRVRLVRFSCSLASTIDETASENERENYQN